MVSRCIESSLAKLASDTSRILLRLLLSICVFIGATLLLLSGRIDIVLYIYGIWILISFVRGVHEGAVSRRRRC